MLKVEPETAALSGAVEFSAAGINVMNKDGLDRRLILVLMVFILLKVLL